MRLVCPLPTSLASDHSADSSPTHSLIRIGVLDEQRMRLDYVLALKVEDFLERRLQTQVFKSGLAKSIHHARVLIRQRHIRCVRCCPAGR